MKIMIYRYRKVRGLDQLCADLKEEKAAADKLSRRKRQPTRKVKH